jgi:hypothetical protein
MMRLRSWRLRGWIDGRSRRPGRSRASLVVVAATKRPRDHGEQKKGERSWD